MLFKDDFPNKGKKRAISRPFAIAIRAARLYTAWLRYRSYYIIPQLSASIHSLLFNSGKGQRVENCFLRRSFLTFEELLLFSLTVGLFRLEEIKKDRSIQPRFRLIRRGASSKQLNGRQTLTPLRL
jgi:hypothetical protein